MNAFTTSSLVGGNDGILSQDIYFLTGEDHFVLNDSKKSQLDLQHPISQINVSCGLVVDGISVTYQLSDGTSTTMTHGSPDFPNVHIIKLNHNERLAGVFGRAGPHSFFHRQMVNTLSFVIHDSVKGTARIDGPHGNPDGQDEGSSFYVSDVLAFGSFAKANSPGIGLCGLFFYKQ
ncbi:hypothetical protein BD414DRAFT_539980 [Trametes punicea]|nr:hypothetical protein BD414DRAFT_539980 [Trametes punicea]